MTFKWQNGIRYITKYTKNGDCRKRCFLYSQQTDVIHEGRRPTCGAPVDKVSTYLHILRSTTYVYPYSVACTRAGQFLWRAGSIKTRFYVEYVHYANTWNDSHAWSHTRQTTLHFDEPVLINFDERLLIIFNEISSREFLTEYQQLRAYLISGRIFRYRKLISFNRY